MNYKKLLITGGAGFIGSNFVRFMLREHPGTMLVVLDSLTYAGNKQSIADVLDKITFIQGDITDPGIAAKVIAGVDGVVHFAAESHVDRSVHDPLLFIKTNVIGTATLLEAARTAGIKRFHHISTDEVFGSLPLDSDIKWTEETVYNPRSPYSASKAASDHLVMAYGTTYGLPVTLSNCTNNYGPFMHPEKLFPLAITNLLEGKKVPVYTPGNQIREWLWVEDHCKAIALILEKGRLGEKYMVGPEEKDIDNLTAIKKILGIMDKSEEVLEFVKDRPGHDQKYAVSSEKIKQELGWKPHVGLEEGLARMVDWYKANEAWWKPVKENMQSYLQKQYGAK